MTNMFFKKKKQRLYRDELRQLLILHSISFIVVSIILVTVFIQVYSNRTIRVDNHMANEYASEFMTMELEAYEKAIVTIGSDNVFMNYIISGENQSEVYRMLYDFINERRLKSIFYYVDISGKTVLTNNYIESPYNGQEIFLHGIFKQLSTRPEEVIFLNNKVQIDLSKRTVYSIGKSVQMDGKVVGYLVFDILESELNSIIFESNAEILILTDQYNNVITTTNSLVVDEIGKFNLARNTEDELSFNGKEYYYRQQKLNDGRLNLYTLSSLGFAQEILTKSMLFILMAFVIITIIAIKVADYSAKAKTESISNLIKAITKVQKGDLKAYVPLGQTDEFKVIGEQFNEMLVELDGLMLKNSELVDRNRLSEIKQLESQFNPHFIFNTLETLKYMIHIDIEKASEIIVNFGTILRYSIDYEKKNIPLDQDLDYLNSYLLLQKYRYNQRLTYHFDIQQEAKDCIIPKLIMQPIIENCINHGYRQKEHLNIEVKIEILDETLITTVTDNGDGISKQRLTQLREHLEDPNINDGHIGLNNVHRRIRLLYGDAYGLEISSIKTQCTQVVIKIPVIRW